MESVKKWVKENPKKTLALVGILGFTFGCYFTWMQW